MMKRIFAFLLLIIIPTFCFADWVGGVDGRRYVTDEEKSLPPYNNVVQIETKTGYSTGTIVAPNVILTCKHCVASAGKNGAVDIHMPNGQTKTGTVWYYPNDDTVTNDYALIIFKNSGSGEFLNVSDVAVPDDKAMRIGYDSLKVLNKDEIKIVKKVFSDVLRNQGNVTDINIIDAINEVESGLQKYNCQSDKSINCVKCVGSDKCIFGDSDNMKVQDSCSATKLQRIGSGGAMLLTNCANSPGASGSPLIDSGHKNIIGIFTGTFGFGIGEKVETYGVMPESFSKKTNTLINMSNNGLLEF